MIGRVEHQRSRRGPAAPEVDLGRARGDIWLPVPLLTTIEQAAAHVDRVGFAVLFPAGQVNAPSLWEAVAGPDAVPFVSGMGPAESTVWTWKDELPKAGLAWYGKFAHKRASLLSRALLKALYAGRGEPTDHEAFDLPDEAHGIAEALITGPLSTSTLRELVGDIGRYDRAMASLQHQLLVTSAGVSEHRRRWPSTLVELTCRLFDVGDGLDRSYATARFLDTMIEATPDQLAQAFGWPAATAQRQLHLRDSR